MKTTRRITDNLTKCKTEIKIVPQMSMAEFKAWLEGFSECFKTGAPNKAQWKKIEERLNTVSLENKITYTYYPNWWPQWYSINSNIGGYRTHTYGTSADNPVKLSETIMTSAADANVSNTLLCATAIGQEEAKEFTM